MGYYVGYQRSLLPERSIDFLSMTHITVGRVRPQPNGSLITDFDIDTVNGPAMARTVAKLAHQANRKAILMVGGAGEHDDFVAASSSANRATFVQNLLRAMTAYGYDGLDVDWEPIATADHDPLLALLRDLRTAQPSIILTVPVAWVASNAAVDPWYSQMAAVVDQVNVMTYGMADNWGGWQSWHSSALGDAQPSHPSSVASSGRGYVSAGVPAAKLGIGISLSGACWHGATAPRQSLAPTAGVYAGDNAMSYSNIMSQYYETGARKWDTAASVPYLSFDVPKGPKGCSFISYDDAQSIAAKGAWIKANHFGGAIVWTIAQGHVSSAPAGQQDSLLKTTYEAVVP